MKPAAVVIDDWKLMIFKKHLDKAGYKFTSSPSPAKETLLLRVEYEWISDLKPIIEAANQECKKYGKG